MASLRQRSAPVNTIKSYAHDLCLFVRAVPADVSTVTAEDIQGQRERTVMLTAAPESIHLLRRHLKQSHITSGSVFRGDPRYGGSPLPLEYLFVSFALIGH